jgi:hypothetical protein
VRGVGVQTVHEDDRVATASLEVFDRARREIDALEGAKRAFELPHVQYWCSRSPYRWHLE